MEVYVDDETKLTLHGLQQHYVKLKENEKNKKLFELLDVLEFNQVVIFVKSVQRCMALAQLLTEQNFPAIGIHRGMVQEERLSRYQQFKDFQKVTEYWISLHWLDFNQPYFCVDTAYFGRHQFIRPWHGYWTCQHRIQLRYAGRFRYLFASCRPCWTFWYQRLGYHFCLRRVSFTINHLTRSGNLLISFVILCRGDAKILNEVQDRFDVNISELPDEIDLSSYSKFDSYEIFTLLADYYAFGGNLLKTMFHFRFVYSWRTINQEYLIDVKRQPFYFKRKKN